MIQAVDTGSNCLLKTDSSYTNGQKTFTNLCEAVPPHAAARQSVGLDLKRLASQVRSNNEVAGGRYSTACYITDSWPVILYLAYAYADDLKAALLANTNLGGDNVHRGAVLGLILGLGCGRTVDTFFNQLAGVRSHGKKNSFGHFVKILKNDFLFAEHRRLSIVCNDANSRRDC